MAAIAAGEDGIGDGGGAERRVLAQGAQVFDFASCPEADGELEGAQVRNKERRASGIDKVRLCGISYTAMRTEFFVPSRRPD